MLTGDLGLQQSTQSSYIVDDLDTMEGNSSYLSSHSTKPGKSGYSLFSGRPSGSGLYRTGAVGTQSSKWRTFQTKPASTALTLEQKFRCCQLHDGGMAMKNLCLQFNQSKAVIQNVINNKQKIMTEWFRFSNPYIQKKQRALKSPAYAEINSAILEWYWASKAAGKALTGVGIQAKAKAVAEELGYHSFKASNGNVHTFILK